VAADPATGHAPRTPGTAVPVGRLAGRSRPTRQLRAVLAELSSTQQFRSAQVLHADLRAAGHRIGLATVYRTLHDLNQAGLIDTVADPGGETLFRRSRTDRHHHCIVCRRCGLGVEISSPAFERRIAQMGTANGFVDLDHRVEIFGTCRECAKPDNDLAALPTTLRPDTQIGTNNRGR
jgi:Fur family transcriptional regulator, ferric uptake regulator